MHPSLGKLQVSGPAEEPVTLEEAKLAAQIDHSEEDTLISAYITAARELLESFTRRQFITATWDITAHTFPGPFLLQFPIATVQTITHVKYYDLDGIHQTLSSDIYTIDTGRTPQSFYLAFNKEWPQLRDQRDAVQIRAVFGYGTAADVPESLKAAIKFTVSHWLHNPGCNELPPTALNLATPYQVTML